MQSGFILSQHDIKKIIAEHFHVSEDKFVVVQDKPTPKEAD